MGPHRTMVALWTALAAASVANGQQPNIIVRVYDYAGLPGDTLRNASLEAQKIFRKAGVETEWVECPLDRGAEQQYPACMKPVGPADATLRIVPQAMQGYPVPQGAFGFALPSGDERPAAHAYVFNHRVEEAAEQSSCSGFRLLGHVMAHEVGHLLLGVNEHSSRGIMRPKWLKQQLTQAESGQLVFPRGQAARLQAAIRARQ